MRILLACVGLAVAAAIGGVAFVYSGLADVAATSHHWPPTRWILSTTMESSVRRHAHGITPPDSFDGDDHVHEGAVAYDEMCASCHGAPGSEPGVVGKGLNPEPPDLSKEADAWSAAEIFWVTENGVRMTGMPAFGPTHSEDELWDLVALVKRLPRLSTPEYRALLAPRAGDELHHHAHDH
jgi:mono/diheme cytochrome c family protein